MKTKFRVAFYLRTGFVKKDGTVPIRGRMYLNNERIELENTGLSTLPGNWCSEKNRCKGRSTEAAQNNAELDRIESDLQHIFRRFEFSELLCLERIKAEYYGTMKSDVSLMEFWDQFLERLAPEVNVTRTKASYGKYDVLKRHFAHFLQVRYKRKDVKMTELNYTMMTEFQTFMLNTLKLKYNTVMRSLRNFKTVTIQAQKHGLLLKDPFVNMKLRQKCEDRGFLTDEEINQLLNHKFEIKRLEQVRDIFIFSCFTGLAYIDMAKLTRENIVVMDGREWIMTRRQKTDVPTNILLLNIPKKLIEKYAGVDPKGRLLPIITNQRMNAYLKEIADLCGIEKNLTCHVARHTFATMALSKGVPIESVSKMLGHTNVRTTQLYARITNKKVEHDMLELATKLGGFNCVGV